MNSGMFPKAGITDYPREEKKAIRGSSLLVNMIAENTRVQNGWLCGSLFSYSLSMELRHSS